MKKTTLAIVVVSALLAAVSVAMAWGPGFGRGLATTPGANLTADQVGKLNSFRQAYLNETLQIRNELVSKNLELRTLMSQPGADAAKISAKQKEIFALQQKLQEKATAHQLEARNILTPEQLSALPAGRGPAFTAGTGYSRGPANMAGSGAYGRSKGMKRGAGFGRTW